MKKVHFISLIVCVMVFASCKKDIEETKVNPDAQSGKVTSEGYSYSYKNVVINPDLVTLDGTNAQLLSSPKELQDGIIKIANISPEVKAQLIAGNVLNLKFGDYKGLRKIETVNFSGNDYSLKTAQAQLGEVIKEGKIDFTIDLYEAKDIAYNKVTNQKANIPVQLIYLMNEYDLGKGFKFNPSTDIKLLLHFSIDIQQTTTIICKFELQSNINPSLAFEGSLSGEWETDMVQFVPQQLLDYIATLKYEIPVEIIGVDLGSSFSVGELHIPTKLEAKFSKKSVLSYGLNGSIILGYQLDINGLNIQKTPIFSNTLKLTNQSSAALYGEIIASTDFVITPQLVVVGGLFQSAGEIVVGLRTVNTGSINLPNAQFNYGSRGYITTKINIEAAFLGIQWLSTDISYKNEQEIWNIGSFNNVVAFNYMSHEDDRDGWDALRFNRDFIFTIGYQYALIGKQLPSTDITISYKILNDQGATLKTVTNEKVAIKNITSNSFKFGVKDVPFRDYWEHVIAHKYADSYITDIVITDGDGYVGSIPGQPIKLERRAVWN